MIIRFSHLIVSGPQYESLRAHCVPLHPNIQAIHAIPIAVHSSWINKHFLFIFDSHIPNRINSPRPATSEWSNLNLFCVTFPFCLTCLSSGASSSIGNCCQLKLLSLIPYSWPPPQTWLSVRSKQFPALKHKHTFDVHKMGQMQKIRRRADYLVATNWGHSVAAVDNFLGSDFLVSVASSRVLILTYRYKN